ncbi:MAG: hypothetical protein NTW87_09635 [Planctomycetota bacterium]|nr:hypothetical protein [Planctomycetota bacterium]
MIAISARPIEDCPVELRDCIVIPSDMPLSVTWLLMRYLKGVEERGLEIRLESCGTVGKTQGDRVRFRLIVEPATRRVTDIEFGQDVAASIPSWIPNGLLVKTRRVWSLRYHRLVSLAEAVAMLERLRRLTGFVLGRMEASR